MQIKTIHISGFGRWTDLTLTNLTDFQTFFGENEDGKSTLKAFILGIFFGYPSRSSQKFEPRSGARFGGYLDLVRQQGLYRVSRYNRTQSELTVTDLTSGQPVVGGEEWLQKLFAPFDRADYEQIFSFDEKDLALVGQLTGPAFEKHLLTYTQPRAAQWLAWAADQQAGGVQLFSKQKTGKRPLNQASRHYQDQQDSQSARRASLDQYLATEKEIENLQEKIKMLNQELASVQEQIRQRSELLSYWELHQEALALEKDLSNPAVNQLAKTITVADQEKMQELVLKIAWIKEQLKVTQAKDVQLRQQETVTGADLEKEKRLKKIQEYQQSLQTLGQQIQHLDQQLAEFRQQFQGEIPAPLAGSDFRRLQEQNYWLVGTILSVTLLVLAFLLMGLTAMELLLFFAGLVMAYLAKKHRDQVKTITAPFAPWTREEIVAGQYDALLAQRAQADRRALIQEEQEIAAELLSALVQFDHDRFAQLTPVAANHFQELLASAKQVVQEYQNRPVDAVQDRLEKDHLAAVERKLYRDRDQAQTTLQELLKQHGLASWDQVAPAIDQHHQQKQKEQRLKDLSQQIGSERRQQLLQYSDLPALKADHASLESQRLRLQKQQRQALEQQQQLVLDRTTLVSASQYQDLTQKMANQEAELLAGFGQYLSQVLLPNLVQTLFNGPEAALSQRIEEQAGRYLYRLTRGRYQDIHLTEKKVEVRDQQQQSFTLADLSTGARDQAYLAVRLALITSLRVNEQLPILIDDAFVNFDAQREAEVLSLLQDLATSRQVLFWSFNPAIPGENLIRLGDVNGKITSAIPRK